jgi:hypothetical protein
MLRGAIRTRRLTLPRIQAWDDQNLSDDLNFRATDWLELEQAALSHDVKVDIIGYPVTVKTRLV